MPGITPLFEGNDMYQYDFNMMGLLLRIRTPFALSELYELKHYLVDASNQQADLEYNIEYLPENWSVQGQWILEERQTAVYELPDAFHRYFYWSVQTRDRYVLLVSSKTEPCRFTIYVQQEHLPALLRRFELPPFLAMETALLEYDCFQLHASVVDWQGRGILFSAPSGTGKSTQAELWRQYAGAEVLNGDRAMIRRENGGYCAYGSPYAGTSGIYTNRFVPISAIVVLSQGPENRLERLAPAAAFSRIYSESTVPSWNEAFVDRFSMLLVDLVGQIPVYHLSCRPDADAVETLRRAL